MIHRSLIPLLAGVLAVLVVTGVRVGAASAPPPLPLPPKGAVPPAPVADLSAPPSASKGQALIIKAPNGKGEYEDTTGAGFVTNPDTIEFPDSGAVLTCSRVDFNKKEKWAKATGKPRMWDDRNEVTADSMRADLKAKRLDIEGNVRMVVRPKDSKADSNSTLRIKEPVVINCDRMEYFYAKDTKRGKATGHLHLVQKTKKDDRTATGDRILYDGVSETVTLEGNVQASNTRGEHFQCDLVVLKIKEGDEGFQMKGVKMGNFIIDDEEDNSAQGNGKKPAPAAPAKKQTPAPAGTKKPAPIGPKPGV